MLAVLSSLAGLGTGGGTLPTDEYESVGYFLPPYGLNH
jgi:hypothetical protein